MKTKVIKQRPNANIFGDTCVGRKNFKPLQHKDGTNFSDVEYLELLGRKAIEMDKANNNPRIPTDYGNFDRETVNLAKEVVKGIDNGFSKEELQKYICNCVDYTK